mmetsp:Transcript_42027/g.133519  ORF Transcript_42027/g.133519 Transcript_42027/m.133519 type:complete len:244 (+) Transcript_42027:636-1367(+)
MRALLPHDSAVETNTNRASCFRRSASWIQTCWPSMLTRLLSSWTTRMSTCGPAPSWHSASCRRRRSGITCVPSLLAWMTATCTFAPRRSRSSASLSRTSTRCPGRLGRPPWATPRAFPKRRRRPSAPAPRRTAAWLRFGPPLAGWTRAKLRRCPTRRWACRRYPPWGPSRTCRRRPPWGPRPPGRCCRPSEGLCPQCRPPPSGCPSGRRLRRCSRRPIGTRRRGAGPDGQGAWYLRSAERAGV